MKKVRNDILGRAYFIASLASILGLLILGKVVYIQQVEGHELRQKAQEESIRLESIEAMRGNILSRNGSLLATTVPMFEIRMDIASPHISTKLFNSKRDSLALMLSKLFHDKTRQKYSSILQNARDKGNRYLLIQKNVDYGQLKKLSKFPIFRRGKYKGGLISLQQNKRKMPFGMLAERTIGYEIKDAGISVGLEGRYSEYLEGESGVRLVRKIAGGYWIPVDYSQDIEPQNGSDIVTSIDVNIQDVAENALLLQMKKQNAVAGCAIVMEVSTGEILAMANLKKNKKGEYGEYFNYAIAESMEPGSTFKLASIIAALEDNIVALDDTIYTGDGHWKYENRTMNDDHKIDEGFPTVRKVFEKSSNVGVSRIIDRGYRKRPQKYIDRLYDMSLNKPLGFELAGEGTPYIKNPDDPSWSLVSLPWMSIGYEVLLTPLQVLTLYNAVANDGKMVKPILAKEIRKAGKTTKVFETEVIKNSIASQKTIQKAQDLLVGVATDGTVETVFKNSPYTLGGKTGTAQIAINGRYDKTHYNATFAGYFPAKNPKYSCIVVISRPSAGKFYASSVAAPVFKAIADRVYATDLAIHRGLITDSITGTGVTPAIWSGYYPDLKQIYNELQIDAPEMGNDARWVTIHRDEDKLEFKERNILQKRVPDVRGMAAKDAIYMLESLGLEVKINGMGRVSKQSLNPGGTFKKGNKIELLLATK